MSAKRPTPAEKTAQSFFDEGFERGLSEGVRRLAAKKPWDKIDNWQWDEWAFYVTATAMTGTVAVILFWLVGVFIRWEVGPIPDAAPFTSGTTMTSPQTHGCYYEPSPGGPWEMKCP